MTELKSANVTKGSGYGIPIDRAEESALVHRGAGGRVSGVDGRAANLLIRV
jgi:hypothetical protein